MNLNEFLAVGNLTRDPELKPVGETKVCKFSLAINGRRSKDKSKPEEVCYMDFEVWDTGADVVAKYGEKGRKMFVKGMIRQDSWMDKDGNKKTKYMCRVTDFLFLDNKSRKEDLQEGEPAKEPKEQRERTPF